LQRRSRSNIDGSCCDEQAEEEKAQPRHPERNKSILLVRLTRLALEASALQLPTLGYRRHREKAAVPNRQLWN
jgi:hypothetical protein